MDTSGQVKDLLDAAVQAHVVSERAWWRNDKRGRWVVLEPGPGRLLTDSPIRIREYVDAITPQRGRRFSSLSRARAFAREIGGEIRHWRRHMSRPLRGRSVKTVWRRETNPWKDAGRHALGAQLWGFDEGGL